MGELKFVESGTFRQVARRTDSEITPPQVGRVIELAGARWRVVGTALNPNRSNCQLAFVEFVSTSDAAGKVAGDRRR